LTDDLMSLDALGPDGIYSTRARQVVCDTAGTPVAEMSLVPPLFVARSVAAQRKAKPLPRADREQCIRRAGELFVSESLAGLAFDSYVELTCRVSGLPMTATKAGALAVADGLRRAIAGVRPAQPAGAKTDWRDVSAGGGAVWARRGEVLAVHAPGNAPGVHGLWPQALAVGYRVTVRPSRRDPFTAQRVVLALRQSGFREVDVLFLPTDYRGADELVHCADLAMVYGGQDVVDKYAKDQTVLCNGPGRTKIVITADRDWRDYLDVIVDSVADLGGMACVNTTAVLVEGDPEPLARAICQRLSAIEPLPNTDIRAQLPTLPVEKARALAEFVTDRAAGAAIPLLGGDQMVAEVGAGYAALRPAVHLLCSAHTAILNTELAFPCVWVAPWSRADGLEPLRKSLVVNAITGDDSLIDDLLAESTIATVYNGNVATHYGGPHIPHDGFLADFLMRNKGFLRG
jgi:acyl-CoA reductase-like NAD-dependent aldehyde dehydrogenase